MREKLIRDPVHDLVVFDLDVPGDALLLRLIDTPEVQRLRRIRQIGLASLAYPGAEHTRLSHSIGVLHLVRRMLARLEREAPVPELAGIAVQCAGLLHDVGHGPFSHVVESFFGERHEVWSARVILSPETGVHRALAAFDRDLPRLVADALEGTLRPLWLNRLVGSQLDADRFDYLLRDSLMTGVKYGVFDLERLILMLRVCPKTDRVFVSSKGLLPVEKYLQSRYQMYRQVYFHKTVTAAEAMLTGGLRRARHLIETTGSCPAVANDSPEARLLAPGGKPSLADYLAFTDPRLLMLLEQWAHCGDGVLARLSSGLLNRRLFKGIELVNYDEQDLDMKQRIEAARGVLTSAGLDPQWHLLFTRSADVPYRPYRPRADAPGETIWIEDPADPGVLCDIKEVSPTIRVFTESPYTLWRVYFPAEHEGRNLRGDLNRALSG